MGFEEWKPIIVMVGMQFLYAGASLVVRAALLEGMPSAVLVVYRQFLAFFIMPPFAFFSRRRSNNGAISCMNLKSFCFIFLLSLVGVTGNQNTSYMSLTLVSPSVTSAMYNLAPAITFLMAYTLGLEKMHLRSLGSMAKICGTIVCVGGAAALVLLKGPKLLNMETNSSSLNYFPKLEVEGYYHNTWFIGCFLALASSCCWSTALILQVKTNKMYPDHVSLTAWMSLIAAFQSGIFALIMEPNWEAWKLTSPLQIFVCFYAGIISAVAVLGQTWCVARRGPLFSAMFQPLCTLLITIFGSIFMHEDLYIGSLIGGVGIISGLYFVLWGKSRDYKEESVPMPILCKIDLEDPLLKHQTQNKASLI